MDMYEITVNNYISLAKDIKEMASIPKDSKPCLHFEGDLFEYDDKFRFLKNYFIDFFHENSKFEKIDLVKGFSHLISFTAVEDKVFMRTYSIEIDKKKVSDYLKVKLELIQSSKVDSFGDLALIAPNADLSIKRFSLPSEELYNEAIKSYEPKKKPQNKNVEYDNVGDKRGRVFVQNQDMEGLPLKKRKVQSAIK